MGETRRNPSRRRRHLRLRRAQIQEEEEAAYLVGAAAAAAEGEGGRSHVKERVSGVVRIGERELGVGEGKNIVLAFTTRFPAKCSQPEHALAV